MAVRIKSGVLEVPGSDKWYVTDGSNSVGPVRLDLLTRGVETGRVPLDSFVRHEGWKVWRPLTDFTDFVEDTASMAFRVDPDADVPSVRIGHDEPLPQFPLSDPGARGPGATWPAREVRPPSLMDFASAEGVPSRNSLGSIPPPPSSAARAPITTSWLDEDDGLEPLEPESEVELGEADLVTDVSRDLLGDDHAELRAVFEREPLAPSMPPGRARTESLHSQRPGPSRPAPSPTDDIPSSAEGEEGWGSARPADSNDALPDDDLRGAADLSDALLLLLAGLVKRTKSEAALLHRMTDTGAIVVCAHGLSHADPLGTETSFVDPIVVAAAAGNLVLAEPNPGEAGAAMLRRVSAHAWPDSIEGTGPHRVKDLVAGVRRPIVAALMLPISVRGRLFGFVELGKAGAYSVRDLAKASDLVDAFVRLVEDRALDTIQLLA